MVKLLQILRYVLLFASSFSFIVCSGFLLATLGFFGAPTDVWGFNFLLAFLCYVISLAADLAVVHCEIYIEKQLKEND